MKISLSQDEVANLSAGTSHTEAMSRAVQGCRIGDWEAKHALEHEFSPLILMLATKRAGTNTAARNKLIELGRAGLYRAAKKFPPREPIRHFRVFALDYIESAMDKPVNILAKFFGIF